MCVLYLQAQGYIKRKDVHNHGIGVQDGSNRCADRSVNVYNKWEAVNVGVFSTDKRIGLADSDWLTGLKEVHLNTTDKVFGYC